MQRVLIWRQSGVHADPTPAHIAKAIDDGNALIWVDIEGDSAEHASDLARQFHISTLTLEMMRETFERATFREGDGYFYMAVHGLDFDPRTGQAKTPKLDLLFGRHFLITSHPTKLSWLDQLWQSEKRDGTFMAKGCAFLMHAVLDSLVDSYFPELDEVDDVVDELEDSTVADTSNTVQARIFRVKRSLALMRRVISPQVEFFNSLIMRTGDMIPDEARPYFSDVHDHLVRAFEILDSYRDLMSGLLDVYLTTVSNRLNVIMKQLTIYAAIFFPITFITGVFGQNFGHSPQVEHDAGYNFWIVLGLMALITGAHLAYFRWKRWF
ncbi:MAG TPA: magnesium/cobalt transporter CorA [Ktedonobacterales bacterium]